MDQIKIYPKEKMAIDHLFMKIAVHDDEFAFGELFHLFFSSLCFFAFRYIPEKETCEDIVQDTFFKIWKNRKHINIETSGRNFLITSVRNNCIDYIRKKELEETFRHHRKMEGDREGVSKDDLYSVVELKELIDKAMEKLPPTIREVFELNRFEGLTYSEIALKYNVSVKSVETYMSKALKILRTQLKDYLTPSFIFLFFHEVLNRNEYEKFF